MKSSKKYICYSCVGESYLSNQIRAKGEEAICSYCGGTNKCIGIETLAKKIDSTAKEHYGIIRKEELGASWNPDATRLIENIADVKYNIARDMFKILNGSTAEEKCFLVKEMRYAKKVFIGREYAKLWDGFKALLTNRKMSFKRFQHDFLDDLFKDLRTRKSDDEIASIRTLGIKGNISHLYHARTFDFPDEEMEKALACPWKYLGPPPKEKARGLRMNTRGNPVFYGATSDRTAIAEVRPAVGSWVAVARFKIIQPLKVLDVSTFEEKSIRINIFEEDAAKKIDRAKFLRHWLRFFISNPVIPKKAKTEYRVTQAIANYLAYKCRLDGIIYPSVQSGDIQIVKKGSLNVALFRRAAAVCNEGQPFDGKVILEEILSTKERNLRIPYPIILPKAPCKASGFIKEDKRKPLKIDIKKIIVHKIKSAKFKSEKYKAQRNHS